jgi:hypothetical protein
VQERSQPQPARRRLVAAAALGWLGAVAAPALARAGLRRDRWTVAADGRLVLRPGSLIDLADTLPAGTRRGGVFSVDASGAPLPDGCVLSPSGLLHIGAAASASASGVVFSYAPPD